MEVRFLFLERDPRCHGLLESLVVDQIPTMVMRRDKTTEAGQNYTAMSDHPQDFLRLGLTIGMMYQQIEETRRKRREPVS